MNLTKEKYVAKEMPLNNTKVPEWAIYLLIELLANNSSWISY